MDGGCVDHNFKWFGWVISPSAGIDTYPLLKAKRFAMICTFSDATQRELRTILKCDRFAAKEVTCRIDLRHLRNLRNLRTSCSVPLVAVALTRWSRAEGQRNAAGCLLPAECLQRDDQRRGVATDCVDQSGYPTWADSMILRAPKIEILHLGPNT